MKILFKSIKVIAKNSPFHHQIIDLLIENGTITAINNTIDNKADLVIDEPNLCVSNGWFDMRSASNDPGHESREDFYSLSQAAMAGGFTGILTLPNSMPIVQHKEAIVYAKSFAKPIPLEIFPSAAVTKNCEGKDFTEMLDLHHAGAVAFTDGVKPIWNADILLKTLQYLAPIEALLINRPEEMSMTLFGQMHEGIQSTLLGLKGMPSTAEELMLMRDLKLLEYFLSNHSGTFNKSILHFSCISSKKSVELIREAKAKGLPISCDVAAHQLAFTDSDLFDFDTNLKVNPPFRSEEDVQSLREGLADGTIDTIVSDHQPHEDESKNLEFDLAEFGVIGLETAFSVANQYSGLALETLTEKLSSSPRNILGLAIDEINVGNRANLTFFDPNLEWNYTFDSIASKAKNSPFIGKTMKGKAKYIINQGKFQSLT